MARRNEVIGLIESLLKIAQDPENQEFSAAYLKRLGILFSRFSLSDNDSPICTPWPRESFEEAFRQLPDYKIAKRPSYKEDGQVPEFDRVFPIHKALCCQDYLVDCFAALREYSRWNAYYGSASWLRVVSTKLYGKEEWSAIRLFQVADHVQNHLACTIIDAREATTESLSRSELYTTLHLMYQGLHRSKSAVNIPTTVYSIAQTKARIIQADFQGTTLHIRASPYIEINGGKEDDIKDYLRWMLNVPKGAERAIEDDPRVWNNKRNRTRVRGWYS